MLRIVGISAMLATLTWQPVAAQKIMIDGSTGTAPLVEALGKAFTSRTNIPIEMGKGLGTRERMSALKEGKIDIAMASHGLNVAEVTAQGMAVYKIAMTPVVFGVHDTVKIENLSDAQLCAIFGGTTKNWKEVGAADVTVAAMARPETEVDAQVASENVHCLKGLKLSEAVKINPGARDMARALAETPGSVGVTSATVIEQSGGKLKAVALNGVAPNEANVASGKYRLTRDAFLVLGASPKQEAKAFIDFVKSPEGAAIIKANGAIASAN